MDNIFKNRAVFMSSLSPGYIGGGSQCTLAFLQAVSALHDSNVVYVGPEWIYSDDSYTATVREKIVLQQRGILEMATGVLRGTFADRLSSFAKVWLRSIADSSPIVYANGDAAGATVRYARQFGLRTVFICQNYTPEYLQSGETGLGWLQRRRNRILAREAIEGFTCASVRVCLTDDDKKNYLEACGNERPQNIISPCYFAYNEGVRPFDTADSLYQSDVPTLLMNSNLAVNANANGAIFFLREVWPQIRALTKAKLILAGRWPRKDLQTIADSDSRIELIVRPEHCEMERLFSQACVCLAIAFNGSGIKLRVAEALRRGVPVVATSHCSRGYEEVSAGALHVSDTTQGILDGVLRFLEGSRSIVSEHCRREHERLFAFEVGLRHLRQLEGFLGR